MTPRSTRVRARVPLCIAFGLLLGVMAPAWAQRAPGTGAASTGTKKEMSCLDVVVDSLVSDDVYDPGRWKPLGFGTLFSEGWDEPWASGPNGQHGDGAPRQGWLNAQDGVFYRLAIGTFGFSKDVGNGDNYTSAISAYRSRSTTSCSVA